MNIEHIVFLVFACFSAAIFGFAFSKLLIAFKNKAKISSLIKTHSGVSSIQANVDFVVDGFYEKILIDMVKLSYLYENSKSKLIMSRILKNKSLSQKMQNLANKSNMHKSFNNYVFRESQFKYILIFGSVFLLVGFVFSVELMLILFLVGVIFGWKLPVIAMKKEKLARTDELEKSLPEMLDVLCLGLRSGLTFDRSLKIFTNHFDSQFSKNCMSAQVKWESGICVREDALRSLSDSYDSVLLHQIVENIIRSLRYGSSLTQNLEEAAVQARKQYKAKQEEIVAKAPVKMMLPTGTLILPAMLIMVLGPVILEIINGI